MDIPFILAEITKGWVLIYKVKTFCTWLLLYVLINLTFDADLQASFL